MPEMDGLTFVRGVRERDRRIPILMVTNSSHLAAAAEEAGVTSYLPHARLTDVGPIVSALLDEQAR
jgi:CheY-like chemotaxis protein